MESSWDIVCSIEITIHSEKYNQGYVEWRLDSELSDIKGISFLFHQLENIRNISHVKITVHKKKKKVIRKIWSEGLDKSELSAITLLSRFC